MSKVEQFDQIRPYNNDEVKPTITRLLQDSEFLDTITRLKFPQMAGFIRQILRPVVRHTLKKEIGSVESVDDFQQHVEKYMRRMIDRTVSGLTVSGLEQLNKDHAYCFVSNHRDISMDPAFVNWVLFHQKFQTLRIAIGDNLLTKPFASDLMRLNKSFIVNRSATAPREKLKAAKTLSNYIRYSVETDKANIWIAQREGRAKDGLDQTNPAIIRMMAMSRQKTESFGEFVESLNIVPVSISYEWDPCDAAKANELTVVQKTGEYKKGEQEDVHSIAKGISGIKGHIHLTFGSPLTNEFEDFEQVADKLDSDITGGYVLHPSNAAAYFMLENKEPETVFTDTNVPFSQLDLEAAIRELEARLSNCPEQNRETLLRIYANPVYSKLALLEV